jgi:hypothetical protein
VTIEAYDAPRVAERRRHLREICEALPEVTIRSTGLGGAHLTFEVNNKKFAYYLYDHHGDGVISLSGKAARGMNEELIAAAPERFFMPAYTGPKGWFGLRLDLDDVNWGEVEMLVTDAYRLAAPKRLLKPLPQSFAP